MPLSWGRTPPQAWETPLLKAGQEALTAGGRRQAHGKHGPLRRPSILNPPNPRNGGAGAAAVISGKSLCGQAAKRNSGPLQLTVDFE